MEALNQDFIRRQTLGDFFVYRVIKEPGLNDEHKAIIFNWFHRLMTKHEVCTVAQLLAADSSILFESITGGRFLIGHQEEKLSGQESWCVCAIMTILKIGLIDNEHFFNLATYHKEGLPVFYM